MTNVEPNLFDEHVQHLCAIECDNHSEQKEIMIDDHLCKKSLDLEIQIQKLNATITTLRARCVTKSNENKRLRNQVSRLRIRTDTLKGLLDDSKEQNLISNEARNILQVSFL